MDGTSDLLLTGEARRCRDASGREQKQKRKGEREPEAGLHDVLSARHRAVRARAHRHRDPERDDEEQDQQDEPDDPQRACHEPHASTGAFIGAGSSAGAAWRVQEGLEPARPSTLGGLLSGSRWTSMRRRLRTRFESCPVGRGLSRCARGRPLAGQACRRPDGANATTSSRGHKATPSPAPRSVRIRVVIRARSGGGGLFAGRSGIRSERRRSTRVAEVGDTPAR